MIKNLVDWVAMRYLLVFSSCCFCSACWIAGRLVGLYARVWINGDALIDTLGVCFDVMLCDIR